MTNYIFAFHGGQKPASPEEGQAVMAKWGEWMESLGDAIVNPGAPVSVANTVHAADDIRDGGGANPLSGFTIVQAVSMEAATEMACGCPILENNGTVEVAEMMAMQPN